MAKKLLAVDQTNADSGASQPPRGHRTCRSCPDDQHARHGNLRNDQRAANEQTSVAGDSTADQLYDMTRRAVPYSDLSRRVFDETLDMLAGRYPSDLFADLRPRVVWDRATGIVSARPGARQLAVTNPGTIPDRGLFRVSLPDGSTVGELDEEMVYESREGDTFLLGASAWRINQITHDRVEVIPAPAAPVERTA